MCNCGAQIPGGSSHCPQCSRSLYRDSNHSFHSLVPRGNFQRPPVSRAPMRNRYGYEGVSALRSSRHEAGRVEREEPRRWLHQSLPAYGSMQQRHQDWPYSEEIRSDPLTALLGSELGEVQIRHSLQPLLIQPIFSLLPTRQAHILQFLFNSLGLTDLSPPPWDQTPNFSQVFSHIATLRPDSIHPASQSSQTHLQTVTISRAMEVKGELCTICQEKYRRNEEGSKLQCGHLFHKECLEPWVRMHSTCPVCRRELR